MPRLTVTELAAMVGGRVVGPDDVTIENVCALEDAGDGDLAFLRNAKKPEAAEASAAAVVITPVELQQYAGVQVVCEQAERAMATVLAAFADERRRPPQGVSPQAYVSDSATLGDGVGVGPFAVVGDDAVLGDGVVVYANAYVGAGCRVGSGTVIHAGAALHEGVTVGADCIIHYNAVIGGEGFGFAQVDGGNLKLSQVGTVRLGDRVEVGALSTVDRAMLGETVVGDGVKIDSHCHVAHNCRIGPECIMAGGAMLAGSVILERGVIVAEDAAVTDHVTIGEGAILAARSGIHKHVPAGAVMLGSPARPIGEQRRIWALEGRLPTMSKRLKELEKQLAELKERAGPAQP